MFWCESISDTRRRAVVHPRSTERRFCAAEVMPLLRREEGLVVSHDNMEIAFVYAARLLKRDPKTLYEEAMTSDVQVMTCRRVWTPDLPPEHPEDLGRRRQAEILGPMVTALEEALF